MELSQNFNAASHFVDRHLIEGRGNNVAIIDRGGEHTYDELSRRTNQFANALKKLGLEQESRIGLVLLDTFAFPTAFWGAIKAGIVPIAINTLLTTEHYEYILRDSRIKALIVDKELYNALQPLFKKVPSLRYIVVNELDSSEDLILESLINSESEQFDVVKTLPDDEAFWLYSSGSTGFPKGVKHVHKNLVCVAETYAKHILNIQEQDTVYSVAKLFFAYGLGNGMIFPFSVGATSILFDARPVPESIINILKEHDPTIFYCVPTAYAALLDAAGIVDLSKMLSRLRTCISAGEALPAKISEEWHNLFDVDIIDGVGSTEMLHIFLSNNQKDVKYGSSGKPVPGYEVKLLDESGNHVACGEIGELFVKGGSSATGYWNKLDKSRETFVGEWVKTGDKYYQSDDGYYYYCGRSDDMFKSGGNWVSPFEVESVLIKHDVVLEAAVVSHEDEQGNLKPKAFVVLKEGVDEDQNLEEELKSFVKKKIELWKYPRWIEFINELPKTATGKIQRYRLHIENS